MTPAPRAKVTGDFTAGTIGQTADFITRDAATNRQIDFNLTSGLLEYTLDGATFGSVPTGLTLTGVTLYDFTAQGSANLGRANLPTILLYGDQGTQFLGTANYTSTGEPVKVRQADGTEVEMTPVTYTFTEPIAVDTGDYRLVLNAVLPPTLPLFSNSLVDGTVMYGTEGSVAPYITFLGETSPTVYTHTLAGNESLSSIWKRSGLSDSADCHLIVQVDADQTLTLDALLGNATLIIEALGAGASDPTQQHAAPAVKFVEGESMTGPFVFRNASGVTDGMIAVSGPWEDSPENDGAQLWEPDSLAIDCDLAFTSPLPLHPRGWFQENDVRVRAGRTLRLETEANTAARLPDVLLTAPTANLAFADTKKAAASAEKPSIPEKYLPLFTGTSGTITFERPVAFNYAGNENDSQGSLFRIGNQGDAGYAFTLNVDKNFSSLSRLVLGGDSGATTLNLRGDTTTIYAATINFDSNSTLTQRAGHLTLGGNGWATWFLGNSSTLVFGDSDTLNGTATATLNGIPYGSSTGGVTTDYTGAADLTVNADATLVLNKTAAVDKTTDYAFYPAGKRSLKVAGGTVRAKEGDITMAFVNPEPQAAPMAVAEIPGLEVAGSAALESADTTSSSLTLDALKGNGDVTLSGIVHIGTVRIEAGKELDLDLRKGSDGADDAIGGSRVTIDAVTGSAGTIRFGLLGTNGTTGEQTVIDSLLAGGFTGTVGFLMPDYSTLDFEDTQLPALPFTLEVQPGQTAVMRLDQYADANIVWPEDCSQVKLVRVDAGPFGGEASFPAWPEGVTVEFHR